MLQSGDKKLQWLGQAVVAALAKRYSSLTAAYHAFDMDHNGSCSVAELQRGILQLGITTDDNLVARFVLLLFDKDKGIETVCLSDFAWALRVDKFTRARTELLACVKLLHPTADAWFKSLAPEADAKWVKASTLYRAISGWELRLSRYEVLRLTRIASQSKNPTVTRSQLQLFWSGGWSVEPAGQQDVDVAPRPGQRALQRQDTVAQLLDSLNDLTESTEASALSLSAPQDDILSPPPKSKMIVGCRQARAAIAESLTAGATSLEDGFRVLQQAAGGSLTAAGLMKRLKMLNLGVSHEDILSLVEDADTGDGVIRFENLRTALYSSSPIAPSARTARTLKRRRSNFSFRLTESTLSEITAAIAKSFVEQKHTSLVTAFKGLAGGNPMLTKAEFRSAISKLNLGLDEAQVFCLSSEVDADNDGHISYKEFTSAFLSAFQSAQRTQTAERPPAEAAKEEMEQVAKLHALEAVKRLSVFKAQRAPPAAVTPAAITQALLRKHHTPLRVFAHLASFAVARATGSGWDKERDKDKEGGAVLRAHWVSILADPDLGLPTCDNVGGKLFDSADVDDDGRIDYQEMLSMLPVPSEEVCRRGQPVRLRLDVVRRYYAHIGATSRDLGGFLHASWRLQSLREALHALDLGGSGKLAPSEFSEVLKAELWTLLSQDQIMMVTKDSALLGKVFYEEFLAACGRGFRACPVVTKQNLSTPGGTGSGVSLTSVTVPPEVGRSVAAHSTTVLELCRALDVAGCGVLGVDEMCLALQDVREFSETELAALARAAAPPAGHPDQGVPYKSFVRLVVAAAPPRGLSEPRPVPPMNRRASFDVGAHSEKQQSGAAASDAAPTSRARSLWRSASSAALSIPLPPLPPPPVAGPESARPVSSRDPSPSSPDATRGGFGRAPRSPGLMPRSPSFNGSLLTPRSPSLDNGSGVVAGSLVTPKSPSLDSALSTPRDLPPKPPLPSTRSQGQGARVRGGRFKDAGNNTNRDLDPPANVGVVLPNTTRTQPRPIPLPNGRPPPSTPSISPPTLRPSPPSNSPPSLRPSPPPGLRPSPPPVHSVVHPSPPESTLPLRPSPPLSSNTHNLSPPRMHPLLPPTALPPTQISSRKLSLPGMSGSAMAARRHSLAALDAAPTFARS